MNNEEWNTQLQQLVGEQVCVKVENDLMIKGELECKGIWLYRVYSSITPPDSDDIPYAFCSFILEDIKDISGNIIELKVAK